MIIYFGVILINSFDTFTMCRTLWRYIHFKSIRTDLFGLQDFNATTIVSEIYISDIYKLVVGQWANKNSIYWNKIHQVKWKWIGKYLEFRVKRLLLIGIFQKQQEKIPQEAKTNFLPLAEKKTKAEQYGERRYQGLFLI